MRQDERGHRLKDKKNVAQAEHFRSLGYTEIKRVRAHTHTRKHLSSAASCALSETKSAGSAFHTSECLCEEL